MPRKTTKAKTKTRAKKVTKKPFASLSAAARTQNYRDRALKAWRTRRGV